LTSKKSLILIVGFLIFIFIYNNNLFRKFYNIILIDYDSRLSKSSGFCSGDSVGYLKYLKKKYLFEFNPEVINYENSSPNSDWPIYDNYFKKNYDYKILLNYPKKVLMHFKPLNKYFFSKNTAMHQSGIKEIIFNLKKKEIDFDAEIIIYRQIMENTKKKIIYKNNFNLSVLDNFPILINYNTSKINAIYQKTFIEINGLDEEDYSKIESITLNLEHKFDLKNYKIIDNYENCYYINE
jgi:hypothetical protein